jgi:RHS repeat-associated protein
MYLQTAIAGNWLTNNAVSEVTFGEVATIVSRGGSGYCLVQKEGSIFWSDNGNTWTQGESYSGSNLVMRCAHFHDGKNGVVAGDNILEYTTDGGETWSEKSVGFNVRGVCMTSSHTAVLVGDGGKIARYTFGGSLEEQFSSTNNTLNSVSFYDGIGYACGDKGVLLKYEGNTWKELTPEVNKNWVSVTDPTGSGKTARLNNISAVDARTAYACGDGGVLLKTVDGGMTWSRRNTESTQDLTAMTFNPDGKLSVSGGKSHLSIDGQTDKHSVKMYYDRLGRVVASQNSKQRAMRPQRFSYTVYDALGRNVEAGELESDAEPTDDMINATGASRFPDNWSASRFQVTRSIYDEPIYLDNSNNAIYKAFGGKQQHLRNRIATTLYQEEYNSDPTKYDHATHYSYDIHGNVATLVQDLPELESIGQRFKRVDYEYGIVSGKVTCMDYQKDSLDGYSLLYNYDGENRVTSVSAKYHGDNTEHELARYEYYRHGPLARMVLGNTLQGVDYAYTLQGWTKGVNADAAGRDMGGDGKNGVKTDVYGYTLQYNEEDYQPIGQNASFCQSVTSADLGGKALYNGNIARMSTYLVNLSTQNFGTQTRSFVYDELNQLRSSQVDGNSNYQTTYTYDANGNLTNLTRNDQSGVAMDNLTYRYATDGSGKILNNRLLHVNDDVQNSANPSDIENQGDNYAQYDPASHNYAYDKMGNLIKDQSEEIAEITWNTAGKVTKVSRIEGSGKPDLQFDYDAIGQRIAKKVTNKNVTTGDKFVTTYYVRDPQGNVLAVYEKKEDATGAGEFLLKERHLYGAGRLGMVSQNVSLAQFNTTTADPTQNSTTPQFGDTRYELINHLGNVMAVITDKVTADSTPMIASLSDYYPYGMTQPGRSYSRPGDDYRFGYSGHEKEKDLSDGVYITEYRLYDARLGRWSSVDKMATKSAGVSPYLYCDGTPMMMVDPDGKFAILPLLLKGGANAACDWFLQTAVNYYFNPETEGNLSASAKDVDGWQILRSGIEGTFNPFKVPGGKLGRAALSASGDVLANYVRNIDNYTVEQALQDFAVGFFGDLAGGEIGEFVTKYGTKGVARGLSKMGFDDKWIEGVLNKAGLSGTGSTWKGPVDYSDIPDPRNAGVGKNFTQTQKKKIYEKNMKANNGYIRSDQDGTFLNKSERGGRDPLGAEIDHKQPKSKQGSNSNSNAQVLSKQQNGKKSNKY